MSRYERKIKDGAAPFLEDGEEGGVAEAFERTRCVQV